jgi:hypothetical protein
VQEGIEMPAQAGSFLAKEKIALVGWGEGEDGIFILSDLLGLKPNRII